MRIQGLTKYPRAESPLRTAGQETGKTIFSDLITSECMEHSLMPCRILRRVLSYDLIDRRIDFERGTFL